MGKQSRRKRERSPGEAKALRYLARLGLPDHPDPGPYRRLAAADPEWYRAVTSADDPLVAYRLLYRDLDSALAEYASRPVMLALAWLRWWYEHQPGATRLLDAGCGIGVLTCAYALALPEAEVIGVDAVPGAVERAGELAGRLGVHNLSFVVGDVADPPAGIGDFDQLVAVTALADAGLYPQHPPEDRESFSTLADVDGPGAEFRSPGVERLTGCLSSGGTMLAFDRTPDASQAVRFGAALLHSGVDLDLRRSGVEVFIEEGRTTTFTRFVGTRAASPATETAALAAWLKAVKAPAYGRTWQDELRFAAVQAGGARLIWGCEIDYAPHGEMLERREIWDLDDDLYGWITTTSGLRELVVGRSAEELWREYANYAGRFATAGLAVRFYEG